MAKLIAVRAIPLEKLVVGAEYFKVMFVDKDLMVPILKAVSFEGTTEEGEAMFRDLDPFLATVTDGIGQTFVEQAPHVYGLQHALELLEECARRRAGS